MVKVGLVMPTFNPGEEFNEILDLINQQDDFLYRKLIIDSGSNDRAVDIAVDKGFEVINIPSSEFGHGRTRTLAAKELSDCKYVIYMTHDVFLQEWALKNLIEFIDSDPSLGVVYGKQEVDINKSNIFEQKAREFNYPQESMIKTYDEKDKLGIKTVFSSDAFAIYNNELLKEIGFFPEVQFAEDIIVAANFIKKGYAVGYCANAKVYHSHNYSVMDEYKRYQLIGKFHRENAWIQLQFGSNESEGIKSVFSEWKYLISERKIYLLPSSFLRFGVKYLGYNRGYRV